MGSKESAAARGTVRITAMERGQVAGTVDPACLVEGALGVVLDGDLADTVAVAPEQPAWPAFVYTLHGMRLARTLDFQDLATGRNLLALPVDLTSHTVPKFQELTFDGMTLVGRFTLGWRPHPFLPVVFEDTVGRKVAGGVAHAFEAGEYRFKLPLLVVPAGRLSGLIGGRPVSQPALAEVFASPDFPIAGYVDRAEDDAVIGWLSDRRASGSARVEARRAGRVIASVLADGERPDVVQAYPDAGACGFRLVIPTIERMRGAGELQVVVAGTTIQLQNSPATVVSLDPRMNSLDVVRLDGVEGWAIDVEVEGPVEVEARCDGVVIGRGRADLFRDDLRLHGLQDGRCMFRIPLQPGHEALVGRLVQVLAAGHPVAGSPKLLEPAINQLRFLQRGARATPAVLPRLRARLDSLAGRRSVSLVMPVFGATAEALTRAIDSVLGQWCTRWELLCVSDGFSEPGLARALARYAQRDRRIRIVPSSREDGMGAALKAGFAAARAGHAAVLGVDAPPEPDAVYHLLRAIRDTGAEMLFTDSHRAASGTGQAWRLRTAFSYDRFLSLPFWPDLLCLRTPLAQSLGAAAGAELVLAAVERAETVAHVPAIACRSWDVDPSSALEAVRAHLLRRHVRARAEPGDAPGTVRVSWPPPPGGVIAVVHGREPGPALTAELGRLGVFVRTSDTNAAALNAAAGGDFGTVLFIDGAAASPDHDWLDRLLALAARPGVGAVGPTLLDPRGATLASGFVLVPDGVVPAAAPQPPTVRDVSALPLAALAVQLSAFRAVGGFDPAMPFLFDADLCLRLSQAGYKVLLDGTVAAAVAVLDLPSPAEARPFLTRHAATIAQDDPWYSPFLSPTGDWWPRVDGRCPVHPPRVTRPCTVPSAIRSAGRRRKTTPK